MSKNWASTLRLPKSTFPPRPSPQLRDQYIQRCTDDFYLWQSTHRSAEETFLLHDGPPYANGDLHAGHALNKILKDIILRVKVQQGKRVSYVPGWDCHGLPIELKALGTSDAKGMTPIEIRKAARKLASKTVVKQMKSFRSYAVMGDWDGRWTTMDKAYEIRQLRLFQQMVRRGLIYRQHKPVYWSPSSGTALAEAELEYNESHISKAAYVRFSIVGDWAHHLDSKGGMHWLRRDFQGKLFAMIWTTTPWTLPANKAIALHDDVTYWIVKLREGEAVIVREDFPPDLGPSSEWEIIGVGKGDQFKGLKYINRLQGKSAKPQPIIHAPFVTSESGTGLVHTAPGHGFDDYIVCNQMGIPVIAPVDDNGYFTEEAYPDAPSKLQGISVLGDGNNRVLELLGNESVVGVEDYKHKYPYDWRTKQPIIMRATAQWFADVATTKNQALEALEEVRFVPETGKNRLEAFVKGRSEWCISRQRAWGVPIPALYDEKGNAVMTEETVDHIISVIAERGSDAWWSDDPYDPTWVPASLLETGTYKRGTDTMDVWFDSGSSWAMHEKQADVYLEGSDQHRGWFQSSLLTRVAGLGKGQNSKGTTGVGLAPYKTLITHGFTLDKEGKKMSKSLGNIISADEVMDGSLLPPLKTKKKNANAPPVKDALGPDALRLWVASSDYTRDIVLGEPVLKNIHQYLVKYRTIIKMLTGSLHETSRTAPLTTLDSIALVQLRDVMDEVMKHNDSLEFYKAINALNRWITNDLSAFYLEALKDRLYCEDGGGVLEAILMGFLRMLAPITPVLVEEAWDHVPVWLKEDRAVVHPLQQPYATPVVEPSRLTHDETIVRETIPVLMSAHAAIKAAAEKARVAKVLGSSLQCSVVLQIPEDADGRVLSALKRFEAGLESMFVVSSVELNSDPGENQWEFSETFEVGGGAKCVAWVLPPKQHKCPRCWRYVAEEEDKLCGRCEDVVAKIMA